MEKIQKYINVIKTENLQQIELEIWKNKMKELLDTIRKTYLYISIPLVLGIAAIEIVDSIIDEEE
jgi:hypothetical protein